MTNDVMQLGEALGFVRQDGWTGREGNICFAAATLMDHCENEEVTIGDMLRCLNIAGVVAEFGARCLYVRTGRDNLGWTPALGGIEFITSKENWIEYLDGNGIDY